MRPGGLSPLAQGSLYWGSVPEIHTEGSEQYNEAGRPRPWLVVSDIRTQREGIVLACPTTSNLDRERALEPFRMKVTADSLQPGHTLKKDCLLLVDQLRAMALSRFERNAEGEPPLIGRFNDAAWSKVELRLKRLFKLT